MYHVVGPDGQIYPADINALVEWATAGKIRPDTTVIDASTGQQFIAAHLPALQPIFGSSPLPYRQGRSQIKTMFSVLGIVAAIMFGLIILVFLLPKTDDKQAINQVRMDAPAPNPTPDFGLLPPITKFLTMHSEFGDVTGTTAEPNWAHGQRQRVQFTSGRDLLFYMYEGAVETVWEEDSTGTRQIVWGHTHK